jgi:hypothetical protein
MYLRKPPGAPVDYVEVAVGPELLSEQRVARAMDILFERIVKSMAQIEAEKKQRKPAPRYSLSYAPALGDRAPDGSQFITPAEFRTKYKNIVQAPLQWSSPANKGELAKEFEKLLAQKVSALGKTVIPPERLMEALLQQIKESTEPFDARSGRVNKTAFETLKTAALAELGRETPIDAVLTATIVQRPALFENGVAHWLGTQQPATGDATALEAKMSSASRQLGTIEKT